MIFIAEIGVNFAGSFDKALRMVEKAKLSGATHVKFQKYNPIKVLGKDSPYLNEAHQLPWNELALLRDFSHMIGLKFGISVFNIKDIEIADTLCDYHKIATRMNRNIEFIAKLEATKKPVFMSIQANTQHRKYKRFNYMWCVPEYPTPAHKICTSSYSANYGLSSHCPDWEANLQVAKLGAKVFENHVCDSREEKGCDIPSSLEFEEYAHFINKAKTLAA